MTKDRVIGKGDQLPWDIPEEMQNFRSFTQGKTIVMGRKTYEGIGRALPKRRNIMLTRDPSKVQVGNMETREENGVWRCIGKKRDIEIITSKEELEKAINGEDEVLILGGSQVYRLFLGDENTILRISEIHDMHEGDILFPEFHDQYDEIRREKNDGFDVVWYEKASS